MTSDGRHRLTLSRYAMRSPWNKTIFTGSSIECILLVHGRLRSLTAHWDSPQWDRICQKTTVRRIRKVTSKSSTVFCVMWWFIRVSTTVNNVLQDSQFMFHVRYRWIFRARRAIRVFLYLRDVTLHLNHEMETALPLTKVCPSVFSMTMFKPKNSISLIPLNSTTTSSSDVIFDQYFAGKRARPRQRRVGSQQ